MWFERLDQESTDGLITGPYEVHKARRLLSELGVGSVVENYVEEFYTLLLEETERFVLVSGAAAAHTKRWKGVAYQTPLQLFTSYSPLYWARLLYHHLAPATVAAGRRAAAAAKRLLSGRRQTGGQAAAAPPGEWPSYEDLRRGASARQRMLLGPRRHAVTATQVLTPLEAATAHMKALRRVRGAASIYLGGLHLCLEGFTALLRELVRQVEEASVEEEAALAEQRARLERSIVQYVQQAYGQLHVLLTELVCDNTRALAQRKRPQLREADTLIPSIHVDLRASLRASSRSCLAASRRGEAAAAPQAEPSLAQVLELRRQRKAELRSSLEGTREQRAHMVQLGTVFHQLADRTLASNRYHESHWLPWTVAGALGLATAAAFYRLGPRQVAADSRQLATDLWTSGSRFVDSQLCQPLGRMYRAVRYDEASMSTINRAAVHAEELVLGVMVREFMEDTSEIDEAQLREVEHLAISGDISGILPLYTAAIRHPIKEALFGSLLRLVLIQVHKVKLDAEKISVVIDQLLRSNELLFQATAMTPAVLLIALLLYQGMVIVKGSPSNKKVHARLRANLRNIELVLNKYNEARFDGEDEDQFVQPVVSQKDVGQIVTSVSFMLSTAQWLPQEQRTAFIKDSLQLVDSRLSIAQRMAVLQRIFHTHSFLQEW